MTSPSEGSLISLTPEALELIQFAGTFLATAQAVQITTPEEAAAAVEQTRAIKDCAGALDEARKAYTRPLDDQKKAYMEAFRPAVEVLERAEKLIKGALVDWDRKQRQLAAEAEKQRRDQERKNQEAAAALLKQADDLAASGDLAGAEALEAQVIAAQAAPAPVATMAPAKVQGASTRTTWKCRILDARLVPREYCIPNQAVLDALANSTKGVGPAPAGCEWYSETSAIIRR